MDIDDPYRELGLTPDASDAQVKTAWRRLAAHWHPDRNTSPQALNRIQRINKALEKIRLARERGGAQDAPPPHDNGQDSNTPDDSEQDKSEQDKSEQDKSAQDEDVVDHALHLSMEEAARGCVKEIKAEMARPCAACCGSGLAPEPMVCPRCNGAGRARPTLWFPWLASTLPCDGCQGEGSLRVSCEACDGSGQAAPRRYSSRVRIPAGVRDGYLLHARVRLQGQDGHQPLNVRVALLPHEFFTLEADGTVRVEVPVDGFAWTSGRWIDVPTPHGLRQMRLQRGALTYRIKGEGFPQAPSGPRADCFVTVVPLFPNEWSTDQAALLDKLIATNTGDPTGEAGTRAQAWKRAVTAWQARHPAAD